MTLVGQEFEPSPVTVMAGSIIQDDLGRVLLIHRNTPEKNQWEIIGGKSNPGEDPTLTAAREAGEEAGIDIEVEQEAGRAHYFEDKPKLYIWYNSKIVSGTPHVVESIHDDIEYFSWAEMAALPSLSVSAKHLLSAHQKGELRLPPPRTAA